MTKDDKQFFKGLVSDMDQGWDEKLSSMDQRWDEKLSSMDQRWDEKLSSMDQRWDKRFNDLKTELKSDIRHNGVMIEHIQDLIQSVAENTLGLNRRLTHVEHVLEIK